jgi:hypothetical protein
VTPRLTRSCSPAAASSYSPHYPERPDPRVRCSRTAAAGGCHWRTGGGQCVRRCPAGSDGSPNCPPPSSTTRNVIRTAPTSGTRSTSFAGNVADAADAVDAVDESIGKVSSKADSASASEAV